VADAKLARCPRCKAYGLVAEHQGLRTAVDIAPVDAVRFGQAVVQAVGLWWVENEPGRPARLLGGYSAARRPSWGAGGAQTGSQRLHAEHSCGAHARDMVIVPVSTPKDSAPATPGALKAGNLLLDAPVATASAPARPSPATYATSHPSDHAVRCYDCRKLIDQARESFTGIFHERWVWAVHEEC
jgi:phage FluMu protein Com